MLYRMKTKRVPLTFRIARGDRELLKSTLALAGISLQDFGASVVDSALKRRRGLDPCTAVRFILDNPDPGRSFRQGARDMVFGTPDVPDLGGQQ